MKDIETRALYKNTFFFFFSLFWYHRSISVGDVNRKEKEKVKMWFISRGTPSTIKLTQLWNSKRRNKLISSSQEKCLALYRRHSLLHLPYLYAIAIYRLIQHTYTNTNIWTWSIRSFNVFSKTNRIYCHAFAPNVPTNLFGGSNIIFRIWYRYTRREISASTYYFFEASKG